jgi:anti-sigma factor RsiW
MNAAKQNEPSEIELLLPWYAAGTLDAHESQQVERALANDPELAARYAWVRAELEQETHVSDAAGEPSARDVKTLFAKIDALPAQKSRTSIDIGARIAEFLAALSPRTLAWSAMAAALAIVLQAGFLAGFVLKEKSPGGFETASAPANVSGEGSYVLLRFQPQAIAADVANFLETNKLSIVGGPSTGGLYLVRVAPTKLAKADLMQVVNTLQDNKLVGFVAVTE